MKARALLVAIPLVAFPALAHAHFKLQQPDDWLQTDTNGDPLGGTQKLNPCGQGSPSGAITQVQAGQTLHIKLTETIPHGGHYRVALIPKLNPVSTDIPEPAVTLDTGGQCQSAAIESPVVAPVLADNLFPHTQAEAISGKVYETDIQLPATAAGDMTLQVLEFMAPHAPQCFYHHCAQLRFVTGDAGITPRPLGDGGVTTTPGVDGGGQSFAPAPTSITPVDSGGCAIGDSRGAGTFASMLLGLVVVSVVRRRRCAATRQ